MNWTPLQLLPDVPELDQAARAHRNEINQHVAFIMRQRDEYVVLARDVKAAWTPERAHAAVAPVNALLTLLLGEIMLRYRMLWWMQSLQLTVPAAACLEAIQATRQQLSSIADVLFSFGNFT